MGTREVIVVVSGLTFGSLATWLNVPPEDYVLDNSARRIASLVVNAGAAWAGVAVLGGWLLASVRRGLVGGPLALVPAVVAYYLLGAVAGSENPDGSSDLIATFGLVALVAGPPLGVLGGLVRRSDRLGLAAALVLPLGVGLELVWRSSTRVLPPDPARPDANLVLVILALAGVAVAVARHVNPAQTPDPARRRDG